MRLISRTLQDTPIQGKQTRLHLNVYKYDCLNLACPDQTFTETLPFAGWKQVRTDALNTFILGVAIFLSNNGASKVLALLGVNVSNDTIQSLYDRIEFVDDIAIKRGNVYAPRFMISATIT
ncbi:hypothetical protein MK904_07955 [Loigolactobacillus coryniformis]|uniref:hypothetical protein n=1 Tax=Loigolactobacillus coryniformis TaxID=1610 RepID=UPI00233F93E1|nr:hypothetical protein [Loigolactobacillus coryniformis]MDC4186037.1 hypothetical protein [Loigolactobacillus coryniformis]